MAKLRTPEKHNRVITLKTKLKKWLLIRSYYLLWPSKLWRRCENHFPHWEQREQVTALQGLPFASPEWEKRELQSRKNIRREWAWQYVLVILVLGSLRQEEQFESSLSYTVRSSLPSPPLSCQNKTNNFRSAAAGIGMVFLPKQLSFILKAKM